MRIVALVARVLLGLMFVVFGLNGFLHFLPMKMPDMSPVAMQYMGAIVQSKLILWAFAMQLIGGALLLSGYFVPLALVLLGPIVANILLFHGLMEPAGIVNGLGAFLLWLIVFFWHRASFAGIFRAEG